MPTSRELSLEFRDTHTPEFRDRGKRILELVVHRNFVTVEKGPFLSPEFRDTHTHYHFGTLELVTVVHQIF